MSDSEKKVVPPGEVVPPAAAESELPVVSTTPEVADVVAEKHYEVKVDEKWLVDINAKQDECTLLEKEFDDLPKGNLEACADWWKRGREWHKGYRELRSRLREQTNDATWAELKRLLTENNLPAGFLGDDGNNRLTKYKTAGWRDFSRLDGGARKPEEIVRRKAEAFLPDKCYLSSENTSEGTLRSIWEDKDPNEPWPGLAGYNSFREKEISRLTQEMQAEPKKFEESIGDYKAIIKSVNEAFSSTKKGLEKLGRRVGELEKKAESLPRIEAQLRNSSSA
ncbi:MAG: hypothetical protein WA057_06320 [Candidatus Magasanikiibacteriota bacterium]